MQTQRDHVHAHTFMMGRLSSALVEGDPTGAEIPGRRAQTGLLVGLIMLLLLVGGFAVYGWIVPGGSKAYRQASAILVEKETGNRYVYLDGTLHQTTDLTSAMLIQGAAAKVKLISRNSIEKVPRGRPLGVAGAPQQMPAPDALTRGPWLVCLPGSVVTTRRVPGLGVNLEPATPSAPPAEGRFLVVRGPGGVPYLLANHRKYRVDDDAVLVALGAAAIDPPAAPAMWLGWIADGPALAPAKIAGAGRDGPRVGDRSYPVGTLFRQGGDQHFVLRDDGLAPMSRTEFLFADAKTPGPPVAVDPADVVGARRSADRSLLDRLPDLAALRLADSAGQAVCVRQRPVTPEAVESLVVLAPPWAAGVHPDGTTTVLARRGSGMAVLPVPLSSRTAAKKVSFISDEGTAYRLADQTTVASLKLASTVPVPFPKELLTTLPQGPALSREAVTSLARG